VVTQVPHEQTVDALGAQWATLIDLADSLNDDQWGAPSILAGWSVADLFAHIAGTEWSLTGRTVEPIRAVADLDHVRNPIGELNENWLDHYRTHSRAEVIADLREVTDLRGQALRTISESDWNAEGFTPAGKDSHGRFMRIRVFDCWIHEVDVRDSLGLGVPGDPAPAAVTRAEMAASLPFLIGKRARAPIGSTVTVDFTGIAPAAVHVSVGERATVVPTIDGAADVVLHVDVVDYARLIGARTTADTASVTIDGDVELGQSVVSNLHYLI
jgi:uncharacterized protein (TIGR03083 family)